MEEKNLTLHDRQVHRLKKNVLKVKRHQGDPHSEPSSSTVFYWFAFIFPLMDHFKVNTSYVNGEREARKRPMIECGEWR